MAFSQQQYPRAQYHFLGSNDQDAFRREQINLEKRRKQQTQHAIAVNLSKMDKVEFGDDILNYMFESEVNTLPDVASIDIQTEIEWYMRPYLIDFLVEAHAAFQLTPETFFLTLNILDRYCSKRVVYRKHYQLVGCTALLIAAKYDETSKQVPHIKELMGMCCGLYDEDMFVQMERHVLMTLEWHIGAPTVAAFIRSALDDAPYDAELEHMSMYICEIAMYHKEFISLRPSNLAKASIALSQFILGRRNVLGDYHWSATKDQAIVIALSTYLTNPSDILIQKYKQPHYSFVALVVDSFIARQNAIAEANSLQTPPITPDSSPEHPSTSCTPRKRRYPYETEMPPTPPITPGTTAPFSKDYCPPQNVFIAPDTPTYDVPTSYTSSFTMVDAP